MAAATSTSPVHRPATVGPLLRQWRQRRRLSQLELALRADVSTRHVSFVETGRARPTSEMILRLAEHLDVPLRERNTLLVTGGFAPAFPERSLGEPSMAVVSDAIAAVLEAHLPHPALVVDQHWDLVDSNRGVDVLVAGAATALLEPPVNVLRLSLHPDGLAPRIANLPQWRAHLLGRLDREVAASGDPGLGELREELAGYPVGGYPVGGYPVGGEGGPTDADGLLVPLRLRVGDDLLALVSLTTVFGTPREVTVSELAIETFHPADAGSAAVLRRLVR